MTKLILLALVALVAVGCAPLQQERPGTLLPARLTQRDLRPLDAGLKLRWPTIELRALSSNPAGADRSVGASGLMGATVNEVVPIPGTDMVRAGAVPEGSLFQNSFRNATADAAGRAGLSPTGATIIFVVTRP